MSLTFNDSVSLESAFQQLSNAINNNGGPVDWPGVSNALIGILGASGPVASQLFQVADEAVVARIIHQAVYRR